MLLYMLLLDLSLLHVLLLLLILLLLLLLLGLHLSMLLLLQPLQLVLCLPLLLPHSPSLQSPLLPCLRSNGSSMARLQQQFRCATWKRHGHHVVAWKVQPCRPSSQQSCRHIIRSSGFLCRVERAEPYALPPRRFSDLRYPSTPSPLTHATESPLSTGGRADCSYAITCCCSRNSCYCCW